MLASPAAKENAPKFFSCFSLNPSFFFLDEPDSGVDVESLKLIATEIERYVESSGSSALIITHKGDILEYIKAKYGCILLGGKFHCYTHPHEHL